MGVREVDHSAVRSFLRDWEEKGLGGEPGLAGMRHSGYGGTSYANALGANASFPYLQNRPPGAKYDYQLEAGDLWRNTVAAIAFRWVRDNFPVPRSKVTKRVNGQPVEVQNHELIKILDDPNPFYDSDALWGATAVSFKVDGNAYWKKGQTVDGRTRQFWYVPHWQMFPRWDSDGREFITHYEYIVDGQRYRLRPDQVVHFRNGLDIKADRYGFTELGCAVREVCTDNEAASFCASILRNMGIPGFMLSPESDDDQIDEDDRKLLKRLWREEFTGEGRGGVLVNSVRIKAEKIALSPEELTLDKIRQIPEARICAAIGIRPTVLGLSVGDQQRTYSNVPEDRRAAYEDCLVPMQRTFGKQLTKQSPESVRPGEMLGWDYSDVAAMQEDASARATRSVVLFQGGLCTKDEGRGMNHLPPAATGDGDTYFAGQPMHGALPKIEGNQIGGEE